MLPRLLAQWTFGMNLVRRSSEDELKRKKSPVESRADDSRDLSLVTTSDNGDIRLSFLVVCSLRLGNQVESCLIIVYDEMRGDVVLPNEPGDAMDEVDSLLDPVGWKHRRLLRAQAMSVLKIRVRASPLRDNFDHKQLIKLRQSRK